MTEGPDAVRELIALGTQFDHHPDGELSLTREGGHHRDRIAHAGGDATGAEIQRALIAAVERAPEIEVIQHALAVDLLRAEDGGVAGLTLHVLGEGQHDGVGAVHCRAVVLASGGLGQVFSQSTNPSVSTGDGMALAMRAGARVRDLEFVQFHPTVMWLGPDSQGQQPLISEAVRGEGAFLVDFEGNRFMQGQHELADLAPRDVVAKAITRRMIETGQPHMWLDARHLGADFWERRFPTILGVCRQHGVDPVTELIPVAPAQHYASGGVATDLWGRTTVPGLYATGEVACSGVHGANRLASNSLLEGLVFSRRIADVLPGELRAWSDAGRRRSRPRASSPATVRSEMQDVMTTRVGVLRQAEGLAEALAAPRRPSSPVDAEIGPAAWETTNLLTISTALAEAAALRTETRGSHWREDFPDRDDSKAGHVDSWLESGSHPRRLDLLPVDRPEHRRGPGMTSLDDVPLELRDELTAAGLDLRGRVGADRPRLSEDVPDQRMDDPTSLLDRRPPVPAAEAVFAAREPGVVAGLGLAAVPSSCSGPTRRSPTAFPTAPASRGATWSCASPASPSGCWSPSAPPSTSPATSPASPPPRPAGSRRWRGRRPACSTPARRCRACARSRSTPSAAAGASTTACRLQDMAMVKDNHVIAAGGVLPALEAIRADHPGLPVEVEVTTLDQLEELLALPEPPERILLDNMSDELMTDAVRRTAGRVPLEASGGITLERAARIGATGVDFVSVGALTHSVVVFDIGMDLDA